MGPRKRACALIVLFFSLALHAQPKVDAGNLYHRVIGIVPMIGKGTWDDPKRPMFAPVNATPTDRTGIIAYQHQPSDDGTMAIVEFVAVNRSALLPILISSNPSVLVFEVGKHTQAAIEPVIQRFKKNFSFASFQALRVQ